MSNREVMQQALEALELSAVTVDSFGVQKATQAAITALKAALEQQAEPVACKTLCELCVKRGYDFCANAAKTTPIICPPKQQAEPPQRPWVGLTDEEILSTDPWEILRADPWMGTSDSNINPYQILLKVRTLEAKLKERNT